MGDVLNKTVLLSVADYTDRVINGRIFDPTIYEPSFLNTANSNR